MDKQWPSVCTVTFKPTQLPLCRHTGKNQVRSRILWFDPSKGLSVSLSSCPHEPQDPKAWQRGSRMAAVCGCGPASIYGGHGGLNTLKQGLRGSRGRRRCSIHVTSCTHKGLTHPAKTPALKVGMGLLHPAPRCSKPAVLGLHLCCWKVPVHPAGAQHLQHPPCPPCPGNPHISGSPSLATGSSGGEAELDWQEAPGAGNDNMSTHLSVIKSCV